MRREVLMSVSLGQLDLGPAVDTEVVAWLADDGTAAGFGVTDTGSDEPAISSGIPRTKQPLPQLEPAMEDLGLPESLSRRR